MIELKCKLFGKIEVDLFCSFHRKMLHNVVDELMYISTIVTNGDKREERVVEADELDLNKLSFYHNLEVEDFYIFDKSVEELEEEVKYLHSLISNLDYEGLRNYNGSFPLNIECEGMNILEKEVE